jgi:hypothetical protein
LRGASGKPDLSICPRRTAVSSVRRSADGVSAGVCGTDWDFAGGGGRPERPSTSRSSIRNDDPGVVGGCCGFDQADLVAYCSPDPGYGPPVLGLHLYSWALFVFGFLIASSAIGLLGLQDRPGAALRGPAYVLCGLIVTIGITVALATFVMQGFHVELPGDPTRYELLHIFER